MNKKHLLLTLALAGVAAFSVGAFAGCGNNDNTPDNSGENPPAVSGGEEQGTEPTVTSSSVEKTATVTSWTTGTYSDVKVLYLNENVMVNYTKYTLALGETGYTLKQQKANTTVLDEDSTETGENILVIGTDLPSATIPGAGGSVGGGPGGPGGNGGAGGPSAQAETGGAQTTDAADGRKVKVEFSDAADAVDGQGNLLNVDYSGTYWVQNGDYVLLSALAVDTDGAKVTSNTFIKAQTAGMVVKLATGGKFEIVNDFDVSYTTAEADKNEFMGWSTTYTLSYIENVGYLLAEVKETYPKNEDDEVNWSAEPTQTSVTVYIGKVYTAYSDGSIKLGECKGYSVGMNGTGSVGNPKGGWYNNGFEVKVDSDASTFEITSEDAGGQGDISGGPQQGGTQGGPQS